MNIKHRNMSLTTATLSGTRSAGLANPVRLRVSWPWKHCPCEVAECLGSLVKKGYTSIWHPSNRNDQEKKQLLSESHLPARVRCLGVRRK